MAKTSSACVKDRVGRSGCDRPKAYLTDDTFLNIYNRKTYDIPKNSQFSYLCGDITYHCVLQKWPSGRDVKDNFCVSFN